jgi:hypothetical protein
MPDELVEAADLPVVGVFLVEKLKAMFAEHAKEFVPGYRDKFLILAAIRVVEIDAQDLGAVDHRKTPMVS